MIKNFFNIKRVVDGLITDDEVVLATYLAIYSGNIVARTYTGLMQKLNIEIVRHSILSGYLRFEPTRAGLRSIIDPGEPYGFVNPNVLTSAYPAKTKSQYIRLATLLTTYQRWQHKLWKEPLEIPWFKDQPPDIPESWYKIGNNKLRLLKEEEYYGKSLD